MCRHVFRCFFGCQRCMLLLIVECTSVLGRSLATYIMIQMLYYTRVSEALNPEWTASGDGAVEYEITSAQPPPTDTVFVEQQGHTGLWSFWPVTISVGLLIFITLFGNGLVMASVIYNKNLRQAHHRLQLSLAVCDFLVGLVVVPLAAYAELSGFWDLGQWTCFGFTFCDVLLCTSSILHLVAIAVDRYLSVSRIKYARSRPPWAISCMIYVVWVTSAIIAVTPFVVAQDPDFDARIADGLCLVSQLPWYQIFASMSSFYVPIVTVMALYYRIFHIAQFHIHHCPARPSGRSALIIQQENSSREDIEMSMIEEGSRNHRGNRRVILAREANQNGRPSRESLEAQREFRALMLVVCVTGAFAACWLPFFVIVLLQAIWKGNLVSPLWEKIALWLGYMNSAVNPIIYTIFSPEYRKAFCEIYLAMKGSPG